MTRERAARAGGAGLALAGLALTLAALPACEGAPLYSPFGVQQFQEQPPPTSECDDLNDELDACPNSTGQSVSQGEDFCSCFANASFDVCDAFFAPQELTADETADRNDCLNLAE